MSIQHTGGTVVDRSFQAFSQQALLINYYYFLSLTHSLTAAPDQRGP